MKNYKTKIISNQEISPGYFRMKILAPGFSEKAHAGQFVMFRVQRSLLLARRDRFALLADAVLGKQPGKLEYRSCLPLGPGAAPLRVICEYLIGRTR